MDCEFAAGIPGLVRGANDVSSLNTLQAGAAVELLRRALG